jgi:excisionase family DNA binding protein
MRWRRRKRGRPCKHVSISFLPRIREFIPEKDEKGSIALSLRELEALRLVDMCGLTQEEAGKIMGISRGTVYRLLESGRKKIVEALVKGKKIVIEDQ